MKTNGTLVFSCISSICGAIFSFASPRSIMTSIPIFLSRAMISSAFMVILEPNILPVTGRLWMLSSMNCFCSSLNALKIVAKFSGPKEYSTICARDPDGATLSTTAGSSTSRPKSSTNVLVSSAAPIPQKAVRISRVRNTAGSFLIQILHLFIEMLVDKYYSLIFRKK